jgi:hypothetical protein
MDFHAAFSNTIDRFPSLDGIIFVDPDGESITFETKGISHFNIRLAGAKMHLLAHSFAMGAELQDSRWFELELEGRWILYICLNQDYSLTAIYREGCERFAVRRHLFKLAAEFDRDIV